MTDDKLKALMELAKKPLRKPLKKLEYGSNVFQFISENDIRSSEKDKIPYSIIYLKYCRWCENHNLDALVGAKFSQDFSKKFEKTMSQNATCYKISPAGFDLSPHHEQEAREFLQEVLNRAKKTKENKKAVKAKLQKSSK